MPCPPELLKRIGEDVDRYFAAKKDEIRSRFENTDPMEFRESLSTRLPPISEPPDLLIDSAPSRIHGAGKNLF